MPSHDYLGNQPRHDSRRWAEEFRRLLLGFSRIDTPELILVFGSKIPHPLGNDSRIWALFLPVPASFILCVARCYCSTVKTRPVSAVWLPRNNRVLHWYRHLGIMIARKRNDGLLAGLQGRPWRLAEAGAFPGTYSSACHVV